MATKKPEPDEENEQKEATPPPKKSKKKLIIFAGIGVLVLGLAIGVPLLFLGKSHKAAEGEQEEVVPEVIYQRAKLDPFIVNLTDAKRYLKVTMLIEYDPNLLVVKGAEGGGGGHGGGGAEGGEGGGGGGNALPGPMKEKEAQIRDAIISVLSSKRAEDLLMTQGKQTLKEELVEAINTSLDLPDPPVVAVYFTEFIVQ